LQPQILVISNPPHGDVDLEAVADILHLSRDDVRLKIGFGAPEVLRATDWDRAREAAESLRRVGVRVAMASGADMSRVPWPEPVLSFRFSEDAFTAELRDGEISVRRDAPVMGVFCRPPANFQLKETTGLGPGTQGLEIAEAFQWMPRLDVYFVKDGKLRRLAIVQDVADFSGLPQVGATPAESLAATLFECQRRFTDFELDARLDNVRPRHRFVAGEAGFDVDLRKMYSFGTLLLRQALESISPELRDMPHYEFGSRLAYVLSKHGGEGE
jgi:hypothetical protein